MENLSLVVHCLWIALLHILGDNVIYGFWDSNIWHPVNRSGCRIMPSVFRTLTLKEVKIADCSNQHLQDIPTFLPRDIEVLILDHNKVTLQPAMNIPYPELRALILSENNIKALPDGPFTSLPNLEILDLYSETVPVETLSPLAFLGLPNLKKLKLAVVNIPSVNPFHNNISDSLDQLLELHLKLSTSDFPNDLLKGLSLEILHIEADGVESLPSGLLENQSNNHEAKLKMFSLTARNVTSIPESLLKGVEHSLETFILNVGPVDSLPDSLFEDFVCDLQEESSGDLESDATYDSWFDVIKSVPSETVSSDGCLTAIQLSGIKRISDKIFKGLKFLHMLDIKRVEEIHKNAFTELYHLEELQIMDSSFTRLPHSLLEPLHYLKYVKLSHNKLKHLDEDFFISQDSVQHLDLSHNKLLELEEYLFWAVRTEIRFLDVSHNDICELPEYLFQYMKKLVVLDLTDNCVSRLEPTIFEELTQLRELSVAKNHLQELPLGIFNNLHHVQWINLGQNKISSIEDNLWFHNGMLEELDLTYNMLEEPPPLNYLGEKTAVFLYGNPFTMTWPILLPTSTPPGHALPASDITAEGQDLKEDELIIATSKPAQSDSSFETSVVIGESETTEHKGLTEGERVQLDDVLEKLEQEMDELVATMPDNETKSSEWAAEEDALFERKSVQQNSKKSLIDLENELNKDQTHPLLDGHVLPLDFDISANSDSDSLEKVWQLEDKNANPSPETLMISGTKKTQVHSSESHAIEDATWFKAVVAVGCILLVVFMGLIGYCVCKKRGVFPSAQTYHVSLASIDNEDAEQEVIFTGKVSKSVNTDIYALGDSPAMPLHIENAV